MYHLDKKGKSVLIFIAIFLGLIAMVSFINFSTINQDIISAQESDSITEQQFSQSLQGNSGKVDYE